MASCGYCGDSTGNLAFECDYCGETFCQSHRLPEAHDCTDLSSARPPTSTPDDPDAVPDWSRGANSADEIDLAELGERAQTEGQPYSVVEVENTVGTTPDPDFESSPDVAVDGSIADDSDSSASPTTGNHLSSNRTLALIAAVLLLLVLIGIMVL